MIEKNDGSITVDSSIVESNEFVAFRFNRIVESEESIPVRYLDS